MPKESDGQYLIKAYASLFFEAGVNDLTTLFQKDYSKFTVFESSRIV